MCGVLQIGRVKIDKDKAWSQKEFEMAVSCCILYLTCGSFRS